MENFAPGLREGILSLTDALRVVVYFVCVTGLVIQVQQARTDPEGITRPIMRATIIVGLVATLPHWFGFTERVFLSLADTVQDGYTQHPMRAASKLREMVTSNTEFSLRRIGETLYRAFLDGSVKLIVLSASLLQVPLLILQFVLKLLCYLFLPVALALYMIPSQAQLATRYHTINERELATVLAALRHYQREGITDGAEHGTVLDEPGIDALCERLNTTSVAAPAACRRTVTDALRLAIARAERELNQWPEQATDSTEHRVLRAALGKYQHAFDSLTGGAS